MGKVNKLQIKLKKGEKPFQVEEVVLIKGRGIKGDVFLGEDEKRQIAIMESKARLDNSDKSDGFCLMRFSENISVEDFDVSSLRAGDEIKVGCAEIKVTFVGKKCYTECPVFKREGNCGLWKKAAFAKVLKGGIVKTGDELHKKML
ncbi:MAG TPA: hypothetical protein DCG38_02740 [Eubacteriaceae bacterium]|jgi:MOSC domain-containing protein YiiM|nr:hypothetical protein [Eubacteriaceae bacterium]